MLRHHRFSLAPSQSRLAIELFMSVFVIVLVLVLHLTLAVTSIVVLIAVCAAVYRFFSWVEESLIYSRGDDDFTWRLLSGGSSRKLRLKGPQWVTESLLILYFEDFTEAHVVRFLPADALSRCEHRTLRRLVLMESRARLL